MDLLLKLLLRCLPYTTLADLIHYGVLIEAVYPLVLLTKYTEQILVLLIQPLLLVQLQHGRYCLHLTPIPKAILTPSKQTLLL